MKTKRWLLVITILLTFFICTGMVIQNIKFNRNIGEIIVYWGMQGDKASRLQQKLKQWGYYDGSIDGYHGDSTFEAVKEFQGSSDTASSSRGGERIEGANVYLLAQAIHGEARGEPYLGKVAVAAVILNRVSDPRFPNTIEGVIYQPGAFSAVSDGQITLAPDEESLRAARDALNGWDPTYGAIYYYNPAKATSSWIWSREVHLVIGKHHFAI